jgi:hypothetical protein
MCNPMRLIYLLLLCVLSASFGASHVYILITKELSAIEGIAFAFLTTVELILFASAAATLAREL